MAYQPDRSCGLTLFIDSILIEGSDEPLIKIDADFRKAFDSIHRGLAIANAHRKTGAGKLLQSWFEGRTWRLRGRIGGHKMNCGAPPGTLMGVEGGGGTSHISHI